MPNYDFWCQSCNYKFEHFQRFSERPLSVCPNCKKKKLVRLIGCGAPVVVSHERLSKSMSIPYCQVEKAMKAYPGSRYTPPNKQGMCSLILSGRTEKLARLKQRNLHEIEPSDIERAINEQEEKEQKILDRIKAKKNDGQSS